VRLGGLAALLPPDLIEASLFSLDANLLVVFNISSMARESSRASDTLTATSPLVFERLHTYFLFPFALDKEIIQTNNPQAWPGKTRWIDGLDAWISGETGRRPSQGMAHIGQWKRASYSQFDVELPPTLSSSSSSRLFGMSSSTRISDDTQVARKTSFAVTPSM
jgi:hypothetical protein